eukprot:TRINITY_DN2411_c0_g1_i3.p1 TRINITY_DN2411_c0_g1~~TRINITY_DN2411_c0_g1_i3.p1  ORF type:complete len:475 (-),score=121.63 TRINITY_DN2411_c0_g1_i3:96-1520(-)
MPGIVSNKVILVIGSGLTAGTSIRYLHEHGYTLRVGSRTLTKADAETKGLARASSFQIDVNTDEGVARLDKEVALCAAVISCLPAPSHPLVARAAITHGKNCFTTSYVSPAMASLDADAREAGVVLLNECGVDPGTDHMSAKRVIDAIQARGGRIVKFSSVCGALPSPDSNNNPFGYKFSWAPRGVLVAASASARLLEDGEVVEYPSGTLYDHVTPDVVAELDDREFDWTANRDSCSYAAIYGIDDGLKSIVRGTYRYKGWCSIINGFFALGLVSEETSPHSLEGLPYSSIIRSCLRERFAVPIDDLVGCDALRDATAAALGSSKQTDDTVSALQWLGAFDDGTNLIGAGVTNRLDALCQLMLANPNMNYAPGETDMILMRHRYEVEYEDGAKRQNVTTTLVHYGKPGGETAIAETVGYPVAIACRLFVEGKVKLTGVVRPLSPELYNPILDELEGSYGIKFVDTFDPIVSVSQ